MAEHNPEAALNLLKSWRTVLGKQTQALENGVIEDLDGLVKESAGIQKRLQEILSSTPQLLGDREVASLIRSLHHDHEALIDSIRAQAEELSCQMNAVRENKTSLGGYKQKRESSPRFMSRRT